MMDQKFEIDPAKVIALYVDEGLSMKKTGEQVGIPGWQVQAILEKHKIPRRQNKRIDWPIEKMRHWYEVDGWTLQKIADELGQKQKVVNKVAKKNGFQMRRTGPARGEGHPEWKGGRLIDKNGYVMIYNPDHPHARAGKYVCEHRLVMEQHLGRYLLPNEVVHHKNDCKTDNRIENLELFQSNAEHLAETLRGKCPNWTPEGLESLKAVWADKGRLAASQQSRRLKRNASSSPQNSPHWTGESDTGTHAPSQTEHQPPQ